MKAMEVADFILYNAQKYGKALSNLKLQKVLYFLQKDYEDEFGDKLITDNEFIVKEYGPIINNVDWRYCLYGGNPIHIDDMPKLNMDKKHIEFLVERIKYYSNLQPWELVQLIQNVRNDWKKDLSSDEKDIAKEWSEIWKED